MFLTKSRWLAPLIVACAVGTGTLGGAASASAATCDPGDAIAASPLCPFYSSLPATLQSGLQRGDAELSQTPLGTLPDDIPTISPPDGNLPLGLITGDDVGTAPVPSDMFIGDGVGWQGMINGILTTAWGGVSASNPQLGMIVVATASADLTALQTVVAITAPTLSGALTITGEVGNNILLQATNATNWLFALGGSLITTSP